VDSASRGRRIVALFFDSQIKEVTLSYSFTPDIYGVSVRIYGVSIRRLRLFIPIEDEEMLLNTASELYDSALDFKYEDGPPSSSKSPNSFYMEYFFHEYEARSTRLRIARRRGWRRTSTGMTVLTRAFLSFPSWPNFLQYEERERKVRGGVAVYASQPMPLI
jgi:hypothetical protein